MKTNLARLTLILAFAAVSYAQSTSANSGTIRGSVLDPSGAAIKVAPGWRFRILCPVTCSPCRPITSGGFEFDNVPFNPYHASVVAPGFQDERTGRGRSLAECQLP